MGSDDMDAILLLMICGTVAIIVFCLVALLSGW
jgi:hypothetical protein